MSARNFTLKQGSYGNVKVTATENSDRVVAIKLHGHTVVAAHTESKWVILDSCGYRTNTTKSVLNRTLSLLGLPFKVKQMKGVWWVTDLNNDLTHMELFYDGMRLEPSTVLSGDMSALMVEE